MTSCQTLLVSYSSQSKFVLPPGVTLDRALRDGGDTEGSWYIKWDVLHYKKDGKWMTLEPVYPASESDLKRPSEVEEDDEEEWDEDYPTPKEEKD